MCLEEESKVNGQLYLFKSDHKVCTQGNSGILTWPKKKFCGCYLKNIDCDIYVTAC